jgi:two-component system KDP operon response regulator KdpE
MTKTNNPIVLVIEEGKQDRRLLQIVFEHSGFDVLFAVSVGEGLDRVRADRPDLILLDLDTLKGDPCAVLDKIHRSVKSPLIVLSAREDEQDIVRFLDNGADDYIVKPLRVRELLARSRAALRRHREEEESRFSIGTLSVDLQRKAVWKGSDEVQLTSTEFALLLLLLRNAGKVLTHRYILTQIWGAGFTEENEYLRVYIGHLRRKLEDDPQSPRYILTASGIGYGWALERDPINSP